MSITGTAITTIIPDEIAATEAWAGRIGAAWQKSVEAIFETGRLIADAKDALPHGDFTTMIESQLPFGARTAQMLMKVATDQRLTNPKHVSLLPPSWGTLYELTKLDDETLERRLKDGAIRPDMQRRDVATGGARSIMASREQDRASADFFPTPPWATRALMETVLPHLGLDPHRLGETVDPACGEGHMSGVLLEYLPQVAGFDLIDYSRDEQSPPAWGGSKDFLAEAAPADWFITNPPFGDLTLQFVLRALSLARQGVAMFVRQQWLEGVERYEALFRDAPPTLYAQFSERVNLCEGRWEPYGSTATAYCWLVWVKDRTPQPPFWIPPGQRVALTRPDDIERFTARPALPPKAPAIPQETDSSLPPSHPADATPALPPFRSTPETDAIIRAGYEAEPFDLDAIADRLGATKLQIRRRANQLGLGSRDRQREAAREVMTRLNAARDGAA